MSALVKVRPLTHNDSKSWMEPLNYLIAIVNQIITGHINTVGSVTLTNGGTTTTLMDNAIKRGCRVFLFPTTAHAATVTGIWTDPTSVPATGGEITINHSSVAQADLNFDYLVVI